MCEVIVMMLILFPLGWLVWAAFEIWDQVSESNRWYRRQMEEEEGWRRMKAEGITRD